MYFSNAHYSYRVSNDRNNDVRSTFLPRNYICRLGGECEFHIRRNTVCGIQEDKWLRIARHGVIYAPPCIITVSTWSTTRGSI